MDNNKVLGIIIVLICLLVFFNLRSKNDTDNNAASQKPAASSTQTKTTPKTAPAQPEEDDTAKIAKLDSIARAILREAELRNNAGMQPYFQQLMQEGVTEVSAPQVVKKKTPTCPPIRMELNGREISGSICVRMLYVYKGKDHYVGYCRP